MKGFTFVIALLLASIFVASMSANRIYAQTAEEQNGLPISKAGNGQSSPGEVAAASGSNRFVVWQDTTSGAQYDIFFKRSTDNGATWQPTVNLSNNPGSSTNPQITVSGSNVFVVWTQWDSAFTVGDVYLRRSTDNGATWGSKVKITVSPYGGTNFNAVAQIAVAGSNVVVVWSNDAADVLERRSADNGATWKTIVNLSNSADASYNPRIAGTGSNFYVAWSEFVGSTAPDIYLRRSTDGGATWKSVVNISKSGEADSALVAATGSNVYVVWQDTTPGNYDVFFRRSTDGGATWKTAVNISNNAGSSTLSDLAASGSNVYVVWVDYTPGNADILSRRSTDSGATWKTVKNLSNNVADSYSGQVAVSGSNVYVAWYELVGSQSEIFLKRSTDGGATWQPTVQISNNSGQSTNPQVASTGSNVYIVWQDLTPGNYDVLSRRSSDSGATWSAVKNLSNNSGDSLFAQIGV